MSGLKNIVFVSGNAGKIKEVAAIFGSGYNLINHDIDLPEIQSLNGKEVIDEKLEVAIKILDDKSEDFKAIKSKFKDIGVEVKSVGDFVLFCEDTSFIIDTLSNAKASFPGALIKFYFKAVGNQGIIKRDGGSTASMVTYVGALIGGKKKIFEGTVFGRVPTEFKGEGTFGFDPSFIPKLPEEFSQYQGKTNAELNEIDTSIKNKTSARALAVNALIADISTGGAKKKSKKSSKKSGKKMTGGVKKKSKKSSKKGSKKMTGGGSVTKSHKLDSKNPAKKKSKKSSKKASKKKSKKSSKKSSKKHRKH